MSYVRSRAKRIDWITLALVASLTIIGWLMIFAATYSGSSAELVWSLNHPVGKQTVFIGIAAGIFLMATLIDWKFWSTFAYVFYSVSLLLLALVLIVGTTVKGATSWFNLFGFSFQPSEFAKFATALALAAFLSFHRTNLKNFRHQLIAFLLCLIPALLILLQPDAGSALVFISFSVLFLREGLSPLFYIIAIVVAALAIFSLIYEPIYVILAILIAGAAIFAMHLPKKSFWLSGVAFTGIVAAGLVQYGMSAWALGFGGALFATLSLRKFLKQQYRQILLLLPAALLSIAISLFSRYAFENFLEPHQQDRINVWLRPSECDPRGSLYNVLQSKTAIGSGGFEGKGFLKGTMTNLNYVPEQTTDFIFSTIGEEQGFIGSFAIVFLYLLLLLRIIMIGERARSAFARQYAYGIAGILFFHFFINIGMTMGIVPIIGIPLPWISYGGSSLVGFTLMIGVLLKMDMSRYSL